MIIFSWDQNLEIYPKETAPPRTTITIATTIATAATTSNNSNNIKQKKVGIQEIKHIAPSICASYPFAHTNQHIGLPSQNKNAKLSRHFLLALCDAYSISSVTICTESLYSDWCVISFFIGAAVVASAQQVIWIIFFLLLFAHSLNETCQYICRQSISKLKHMQHTQIRIQGKQANRQMLGK